MNSASPSSRGNPSQRREKAATRATPTLWQTRLRQSITPYLPPPVVQAIHRLDPQLEPYVGPEPSITIVGTIFLAWLIFVLLRVTVSRILSSSSGRAIADDDDDGILSKSKLIDPTQAHQYDANVLLCGPSGSGKTRLFYQLCFDQNQVPTLTSIKANVGVATVHPREVGDSNSEIQNHASAQRQGHQTVRYMDWPGYASLYDGSLLPIFHAHPRIVMMVDSTQPAAEAADVLYQLLTMAKKRQTENQRSSTKKKNASSVMTIFVACHKSDHPKAKNSKRIRIQLRTELERLLKVKSSGDDTTNHPNSTQSSSSSSSSPPDLWWPAGQSLDFDELSFAKLVFCSTSCEKTESEAPSSSRALLDYCKYGILPDND